MSHRASRLAIPVLPLVTLALLCGALVAGGHGQPSSLLPVASADGCSYWAASTGDDAASGSASAPFRTLNRLFAVLAAGQSGCLRGGDTFLATEGSGIIATTNGTTAAPVTLRSGGGTGQARVVGWFEAGAAAHDLVITDLRFVSTATDDAGNPLYPKSTLINLLGDRITVRGNDISDPYGICINAGRMDAYQSVDEGEPSDGIVIDGNRVHDCGTSDRLVWTDRDSGAHGIYLVWTRDARVTNNLIYRNKWRGFQQWPRGERTLVANNVFYANATHVNIGSALTDGYPWYSKDTVVRDNIMLGKTDYAPGKNQASFASNFPEGSPSYGNSLVGNCIAPDAPATAGAGYTESGTISATARFVDLASDDFRLTADSPCQGKGPAASQPQAPAATRAFTASTASCSAGVVRSGVPQSMTSSSSAGERVYWKPTLYVWTADGWRQRDTTKPWLYARSGSGLSWTSYTTTPTAYPAGSAVSFTGLAHGYYAVVQTL